MVEDGPKHKLTISKGFIDLMEENCLVDEIDGDLACKKCGAHVRIDWFEKTLECQGCDEIG